MIRKTVRHIRSFMGLAGYIKSENQIIHRKLDEALYFIHMVKNSQSAQIGEFETITRIFTGQLMYVDTRDASVAPHLIMSGHWEETITSVFNRVIKPNDIVFDVGANFGYFGIVAGSKTRNKIVFVEANPHLIPYIKKSSAVAGLLRQSIVENVAVSDKSGSAPFYFVEDAWGSSGLHDTNTMSKNDDYNYELREKIKVRVDTIDDIASRNSIRSVDVLKLDVEGVEPEAYMGMKKLVKNSKQLKLFIEFTPNRYADPQGFYETIESDFPYMYQIIGEGSDGKLQKLKHYSDMKLHDDVWSMLVASKTSLVS